MCVTWCYTVVPQRRAGWMCLWPRNPLLCLHAKELRNQYTLADIWEPRGATARGAGRWLAGGRPIVSVRRRADARGPSPPFAA
jgi:hypothetical protein